MKLPFHCSAIVAWTPICAPVILLFTVSNAAKINPGCAHYRDSLRSLNPFETLLFISVIHDLPNV